MRLILDSVHKKCALILAEKRRKLSGERQRIGGKYLDFFGTWNGEIRDRREASGAGRQGFLINKNSDEAGKKVYSRAIGGLKGSAWPGKTEKNSE